MSCNSASKTAHKSVPQNADYVLVLGSKVDGDQMSPSLKERAKTALSYLKTHKQTKVIVTGGKGSDEEISEAEAAYRFLRKEGIKKNRMIKEDQSTSTFENFTFTKKKVDIFNHVKSFGLIPRHNLISLTYLMFYFLHLSNSNLEFCGPKQVNLNDPRDGLVRRKKIVTNF